MPQESLKSVVYRSFLTCDDPKGVVECGTIRISKRGSGTIEKKIESQKPNDSKSKTSLAHNVEKEKRALKGSTDDFQSSPSSLQLMEVSREARKLNEMIDSWSKGLSYDGHSKDIAKDLLKGALDLQDSLVMLGKLQEASRYMAKLKKKQKGKSERGTVSEVGTERSDQLGDHQNGFQKPRLSTDGSSRDCYEELRRVIKESFVKQNLLPNSITQEKNLFRQRNSDVAFKIPFTSSSSSQSSIFEPLHYSSTESSVSSATPPMKVKSPNLIAKLMGLEEFPSKPLQRTTQKQSESEKIPNQRRSMFDIDRPMFKKPSLVVQAEDHGHRKLKEILDTMQFKGLLRSNSVKRIKSQLSQLDDSYPRQKLLSDDNPPIVLIKPLYVPHLESDAQNESSFQKEEVLDVKMMSKKPKAKEQVPSKNLAHKKGSINSKNPGRKKEAEEIPIKKHSQEGVKHHKDVYTRPEEKDSNAKKASGRMKDMVSPQPQRREAFHQSVNAAVTRKMPIEKGAARAKNVPRIQDQVKVTPARTKIPESGSICATKQIPRERSSTSSNMSNCATQIRVNGSNGGKRRLVKKEKPASEPPATEVIAEKCKEDENIIGLVIENDSLLVNCSPVDHPKEDTYSSEVLIGECGSNSESSVCDTMLLNSEIEEDPKTGEGFIFHDMLLNSEDEEDHKTGEICISDDMLIKSENEDLKTVEQVGNHCLSEADNKDFNTETSLEALLLSAPAFFSHAKELFDISVNGTTTLQTFCNDDSLISEQRLSIDCANELTERRSLSDLRVFNPLLQNLMGKIRSFISLDQLLKEICNGVEVLKSYSKFAGESYPIDSLYVMLERDMKCGGLVSGMWDMGWRNGFSLDDSEQVVQEVETLIFSGLIEEVFS
ncbi:uncharacterized protein LOC110818555 isoform X2 [Carica papaya]|nr:uncharacterized protein LOC110818555 isoform X2 [Carica papaya]XP_021903156.1 uncharacterized protein LOC110818555 isoform X2 [Carica papaya]XP_021903157.1 uncharacterized protein LOC110818555 isoform X2 [Carica papaya]XP_021903158.1 uncharacterized protein LOC110818555 isoform X2 [Carica papaya]XP_021903159.1 uncharacterized protein LOC110818555 isoform X2 [Carica papaya]XP_021903160.1 uncharacterized protein LOC110818555 isoform X2 [Carica papaya]XP_021903161.1 uncharacterized protein LO